MIINFSRNNSESNRMAKNLTSLLYMEGTLREGSSLIDPVIMVYGLNTVVSIDGESVEVLKNVNYAYIPEFGRKYFIKDIKTDANGLYIVSMHVDVLSTYYEQIMEQRGIIKRQENFWNLYVDDGVFRSYQNPLIVTKAFPSGFSVANFVLAVAGS